MTRALYIDDQRVDLPEDVRFQLTFQIADFGELRPRGSGSNTIKLPKTPRNTAIFQNCNFVQVNSDFPYVVHSAYYYEDGWLVFNDATVYMLAITDTDFEIQCVWGNSNTIRELKALDMGDVEGLGNVNYDADVYAAVETGIQEHQGEMSSFALSVRGSNVYSPYTRGVLAASKALQKIGFSIDDTSDAIQTYIKNLYVFPAIKSVKKPYRDILFKYPKKTTLLETKGSLIGDVAGGLFGWGLNKYGSARRASFIFDTSQNDYTSKLTTSATGITPQMPNGKWFDIELEATIYAVVMGIANKTSTENFDRSAFKIGVVLGQVMGQFSNNYWKDLDNAKLPTTNDSTLAISGNLPAASNPTPLTLTAKKRLYVNSEEVQLSSDTNNNGIPPVYLAIYPYPINPIWLEKDCYAQVTAEATLKVSAVGGEIEDDIHMPEETTEARNHMTINFADVLRGTTAYDFVTQALINAGAIFDGKDGQTRVFTYNDIADNTTGMLDWSDKLIYIKDENTFNQSVGGRNYIKYKPSEYYNGYGDGEFAVDAAQKLKKDGKTMIENGLFGFVNDNGITGLSVRAASLPCFVKKTNSNSTTDYEFKESGLHLVRLMPRGTGEQWGGYLVNGGGQRVYGVSERTLASARTQPTFYNIRETNWAQYISIQNNYRKAKALFMLSAQDIAELDFKKPIYLRQYAQAYILTKINYQVKGSTAEMLLIR